VLEALVHRQDDHTPGAAQLAVHQHRAQLAFHAGIVALVIRQDFLDDSGGSHGGAPSGASGLPAGYMTPPEMVK
jgi:hypothetical protein